MTASQSLQLEMTGSELDFSTTNYFVNTLD